MKTTGKKNIVILLNLLLFSVISATAQDVTTVDAASEEISENLDLEAVASLFGDAKDLEEFEQKLNDPEIQISNLDLNEDEYVDYLRVVETAENDTHLIAIQAVLGDDIFQDVATIEVEKNADGEAQVQVVGDVYLYGPDYIVEPVYVYRPVIFSIFWRPFYRPYRSVFYWGYYPRYFRKWRPFHVHTYRRNVHVHINVRHTYHRTSLRYSSTAVRIHTNVRRNDYAVRYPNRSYNARVAGVNKANGTKKRAVGVNQADGDKYRAAGVNKANGTKKRAAGVNKADGTKKRVAGVNQADGDKYRAAGVKKADGTTKKVAGVNKANGTKKRVASVSNPDGSKKTVAVKTKADGSKRAVAVNKNADGSRTVKTAGKKSTRGKNNARSKTKKKSRSANKKKKS
ncbi:hypothetical protein [Poritiphilus flavus]|uniref:DUF3300 domain-containing protein n=1 Tax=Poritiphilus flavus TaxID=2697053 RepID=A0A6L9EER8_9FLAO|nr:hypothetical protein [Poritiphilus flavus]NAS13226.1 hypothetical protein [Poritiphilus flavus]